MYAVALFMLFGFCQALDIPVTTTVLPTVTKEVTINHNIPKENCVVNFFIEAISGKTIGTRKCKKDTDCGTGLRCDMLFHWCVPITTPVLTEFEKACTMDGDCSDFHYCLLGSCRFCGPKSCKSNFDCCSGIANTTYECVDTEDLEKWSVAKQLGRVTGPGQFTPHKLHGKEDIESEEFITLGTAAQGDHLMHGKRCWSRCMVDADCHNSRFPTAIWDKNYMGCCNGYCTRRQSCITLPSTTTGGFLGVTTMPKTKI